MEDWGITLPEDFVCGDLWQLWSVLWIEESQEQSEEALPFSQVFGPWWVVHRLFRAGFGTALEATIILNVINFLFTISFKFDKKCCELCKCQGCLHPCRLKGSICQFKVLALLFPILTNNSDSTRMMKSSTVLNNAQAPSSNCRWQLEKERKGKMKLYQIRVERH